MLLSSFRSPIDVSAPWSTFEKSWHDYCQDYCNDCCQDCCCQHCDHCQNCTTWHIYCANSSYFYSPITTPSTWSTFAKSWRSTRSKIKVQLMLFPSALHATYSPNFNLQIDLLNIFWKIARFSKIRWKRLLVLIPHNCSMHVCIVSLDISPRACFSIPYDHKYQVLFQSCIMIQALSYICIVLSVSPL